MIRVVINDVRVKRDALCNYIQTVFTYRNIYIVSDCIFYCFIVLSFQYNVRDEIVVKCIQSAILLCIISVSQRHIAGTFI